VRGFFTADLGEFVFVNVVFAGFLAGFDFIAPTPRGFS
jgi:hypothetical protein